MKNSLTTPCCCPCSSRFSRSLTGRYSSRASPVRRPVPWSGIHDRPHDGPRQSREVITHAFFGVGAPEALLVGAVALIVFGPQGLIDAAKSAAAALRSIQPAIQEINQVSTDIRTSISSEMGIDKIQDEFREIERTTRDSLRLDSPISPSSSSSALSTFASANNPASESPSNSSESNGQKGSPLGTTAQSEIPQTLTGDSSEPETTSRGGETDEDIEKMRTESAKLAWGESVVRTEESSEQNKSVKKRLEDMTMAELEGELARRKQMISMIENLN